MNRWIKTAAAACVVFVLAGTALGANAEKYIHVRVTDSASGEKVSVNVPLSLAEKMLPTIQSKEMKDGKITICDRDFHDTDLRAILDALKDSPDNEFVTVESNDSNIRVAKSKGNLIVHVIDKSEKGTKGSKASPETETVDITVPMTLVNALATTTKDGEIDLVAAIHALSEAGDALLITVHDATQDVRVWVDARSSGE